MEFSIEIRTEPTGKIIIDDFSKEYGQYIDEELEVITSFDAYKYSECVTLNTITKVGTCDITLIDVLLDEHSDDLDSCEFRIKKDGYYVIDHFIIPNMKWLENSSENYIENQNYDSVYVTDGLKIYKLIEGNLEECTVKEIMERNIDGTTIKKCKVEIFFTGNLLQCYINYCKKIYSEMLGKCSSCTSDTYARDFIWMTLNVLDYLVSFKQFMEALRILENFDKCGGFCNSPKIKNTIGCGCSKT